jgi:hypothetical protein
MRKTRAIAAGIGIGIGAMVATSLVGTVPAGADVKVVTLYDHENYSGSPYSQWGPRSCNDSLGDVEYTHARFDGFNDRTRSFEGFSNCWVKVWEHINYGGAGYGYTSRAGSLGPMDQLASSLKLT